MGSSLVLRAATCWSAWHEAMYHLKSQGLEEETASNFLEQAYWELTRVPKAEYTRITSEISKNGLTGGTVRLHSDSWHEDDSLIMIIWTPPAGFAHLLNEVGLRERDLKANPYHISICYVKDLHRGWHQI